MPRGRPALAASFAVLLIASGVRADTDWPGRADELAGQLANASPSRRIELLTEIAASSTPSAERAVVRALEDRETSVRMAAAALVARHRLGSARETLIAWLGDPQADVRASAARALGAIGDTASTASLVRVLGDSDVRVRLAGVQAIAAIGGPDATVPLLDRLADPEAAVRIAVARALGELGDPRAVLSLLGLLQDSMPEAREATAMALGRLRDARAVRSLLGLLRDPQSDVRLAAARALGALGSRDAVADLAPLALRDDRTEDSVPRGQLARVALDAIGRIGGPEARSVLVRAFRQSENEPEITRAAADALIALGIDASRAAVGPLVGDAIAPGLRTPTLELVGRIGGDEAADALIAMYDAPGNGYAVDSLLRALGTTGTPRALRVLLRAAGPGRDAPESGTTPRGRQRRMEVRRQGAVAGLEAYAARRTTLEAEALDPLVEALSTRGEGVGPGDAPVEFTASVAHLIGATGNPRATTTLVALMASRHPEVRIAAARAIARVGVAGVEPAVVAALGDAVADVRLAAADALVRHGGRAALEALLRAWNGSRPIDHADAARALGAIGARTADPRASRQLVDALATAALPLAAALLDALSDPASAGDPAATATLIRSTHRAGLGDTAAEALSNAAAHATAPARPTLLEALRQLARDGATDAQRATATWGLRVDPSSRRLLVDALADPHAAVAANAAGALASQRGLQLDDAATTALCRVLETRRHPVVRANVLEALAHGGRMCRLETQRRMLLDGRQPIVRAAALDSLRTAARIDPAHAQSLVATSLAQCASADPDPTLAARCRRADDPQAAAPGAEPIDAVVMSEDEASLAADVPYVLVRADGIARMGRTGAGGWIHERRAPAGEYLVLDPEALPLEP